MAIKNEGRVYYFKHQHIKKLNQMKTKLALIILGMALFSCSKEDVNQHDNGSQNDNEGQQSAKYYCKVVSGSRLLEFNQFLTCLPSSSFLKDMQQNTVAVWATRYSNSSRDLYMSFCYVGNIAPIIRSLNSTSISVSSYKKKPYPCSIRTVSDYKEDEYGSILIDSISDSEIFGKASMPSVSLEFHMPLGTKVY